MRVLMSVVLLAVCAVCLGQERKVTPVDVDDKKPQGPTLHYYDKHGNQLDEPVLFLAELDTVRKVSSRPVYPLLNELSLGVNFFDAIMKVAGQSYSNFDVWAALSLHNWFFPVVEAGIGFADNTPKGNNFTYVCRPSFYVKAGINYNFLYKSNPDYQVFVGLRAGFSTFSYDVKDITISNGYWGESNTFSLPRQHSTAFYGEALAGLQVKIAGPLSMGWSFRYHFKMGVKDGADSTPWFIPGYGAKSPVSATFSLIYTLPLSKREGKEQKESGN